MEQKQYSIAVEHSQCSNLEYTIFSQSEKSAAVLVLTHDNKEISHHMNEEDNQEITNSWEVINKELNYTKLWLRILYVTSLTTTIIGLCNSPLNIMSQNSLVILQLKTSINSQLLYQKVATIIAEVSSYKQSLCSLRKSTAILFTSTFPSVPVLLVSLSQRPTIQM